MEANTIKNKDDKYWWMIIVLIILAILYFFSKGFSKWTKEDELKDSEERLRLLKHRKNKLQLLIREKLHIKKWRDWAFRLVYPIVRGVILGLWILFNYSAKFYFVDKSPDLDDYVTWNASALILMSALLFLIYGTPLNIIPTMNQIKPYLEKKVYGRHVGIDAEISKHQNELKAVEKNISDVSLAISKLK